VTVGAFGAEGVVRGVTLTAADAALSPIAVTVFNVML